MSISWAIEQDMQKQRALQTRMGDKRGRRAVKKLRKMDDFV